MASISSESEEGFFGGALDVKSFFYHLSLPRELRQFFHLPSLRAGSLHRLGLARDLPKDFVLYPRLQVIPMGWNHALDIAHNAFANIVADSLQTNVRDLLVDGQKPPNINSGIPIVYVDNFVFLASSSSQVSHAVSCVAARRAEVGLPTHELVSCSRKLKVFGWEIDGEARTLRPARVRAWRLYFALDQAIACGMLSSSSSR